MRYCGHCRHWNTGWPARCRFCARGLDGRLCARHHVNPRDPRLVFCGECGELLEPATHVRFPAMPYLVGGSLTFGTIAVAGIVALVLGKENSGMAALIMLVVLIVGMRLVFQMLPPGVRSAMADVAGFFFRFIFSTGNKGRR